MIAGDNDPLMTQHIGSRMGKEDIKECTWGADPVTACKFAELLMISLIQ